MFVQVIQGRTSDAEGLRAAMDRWMEELAPGAVGWLGSTGGVTDDGRAIVVARFATEEDARRNSDRPEQGAWWAETERLFDGPPTFLDSTDTVVDLQGDPDRAGFVQVMRGRTRDPERARQLMSMDPEQWQAYRPDVLGSLEIGHDDGAYTVVLWFTSEAEAREGEKKDMPPEAAERMAELQTLGDEPSYVDLTDPWMDGPG